MVNELKHYGVPGMRWGRRKGERSTILAEKKQSIERGKELSNQYYKKLDKAKRTGEVYCYKMFKSGLNKKQLSDLKSYDTHLAKSALKSIAPIMALPLTGAAIAVGAAIAARKGI